MADLLGQNIGQNYKGLLNIGSTINTPLDGTLRLISDGMGNNSPFQLSTLQVGILSVIARASGTNADNPFLLAYTINNSGGTNVVTGFKLNATETAIVGTTHNLIDLQVGGVSKFIVTRTGQTTISGAFVTGGSLYFNGFNRLEAASSGVFTLINAAGTDFNRLQLGGTTSSFPSIKRNGAIVEFRLADDSAQCAIQSANLNTTFVYLNSNDVYLTGTAFYKGNTGNSRFNIYTTGYSIELGATSVIPASAIFELKSTTQGFLMPRMTTTQRDAIVSPAIGLSIFNTTTLTTDTFDGTNWDSFGNLTAINSSVALSVAGSTNYRPSSILYTINNTAAQTGNATGLFLNATETALNGMTHNLIDLQVGGVSIFKATNTGIFSATTYVSQNEYQFSAGTRIRSISNGILQIGNSSLSDFNRLQLGGTTSSFPAIKRNGAAIDFRLADDSGYANLNAGRIDNSLIVCTGAVYGSIFGIGGGNSSFQSTSSGVMVMYDSLSTSFNRLQFGGTTSSFPSIKRNGAAIDFRLADDSGYCNISANNITTNNAIFAGSLTINANGYIYSSVVTNTRITPFATGISIELGASNVVSASAIFELKSTTQGFLMPRMTTTQKNAIVTPATGLMVYDTTLNKLAVYTGAGWETITSL